MHFNATAETWTVDNDGKADFDNIQAAVDAASGGDVIVVMPGMYTSAQDGHVVNTLGKSVWIRSLSGAAVTTINGQFSRRGIACFNGENKNTIIEGFTITNCESVPFDYDGDGNPDEYWEAEIGGGIITKWSSPTIKNCIFTGNSATSAGGGGIFMTGNTTLIDCYFYSNYAGYGGGAMELYSGSPTIKNCVFEKNLVGGASYGSIYNAYSSATFENCDIRNNSRGFYVTSSNSTQYPTITNSNLCGNAGYQIKGEYYDGGGNTFANACDDLEQGACCIKDACYEVKLTSCLSSDGEWLGQDITCKEYSCIKPDQKTWTVDDDGKADFNNIQAAIDYASDGDEIIVMPGIYTSGQDGHVVNMAGKAVTLRSSNPNNPDVIVKTIISGEGQRRGIACFNNESNNTRIEGFYITDGYSQSYDYDNNGSIGTFEVNCGGGCYLFEASPIIKDCIFNNNLSPATYFGQGGGGIYIYGGSNASILNCNFQFNEGGYGGGIHLKDASNVNISACKFYNNFASITNGADGGALRCDDSSVHISSSIFTDNYASGDGGGLIFNNTTAAVTNSCLSNNTAGGLGGGIYIISNSNATLTSSNVCSNAPNQIQGNYDGLDNTVSFECAVKCQDYLPECPDINGDGNVGATDILNVLADWGLSDTPADVTQDGIVDISDILLVVSNWGPCN